MLHKNKKAISLILTLVLVFSFQLIALAADIINWSAVGVFRIDHDSNSVTQTIDKEDLKEEKITDKPYVAVKTIAKTMSSHPRFKLRDENNITRSVYLTTAEPGEWERSLDGNTGQKGEMLYAELQAAWNQITDNQTISIQFRPY